MTIAELRTWGRKQLPTGSNEHITLEVDWLLNAVLECESSCLVAHGKEQVELKKVKRFKELVCRRGQSEPLAYLFGEKEFCSLSFLVDRRVLIPREETELVVERALRYFTKDLKDWFVVDVGTGSGAIILSLTFRLRERFGEKYLQRGQFVATDVSHDALMVAKENARRFGLESALTFLHSNLLQGVQFPGKRDLNLILCNPPYIAQDEILPPDVDNFEPQLALRAGKEGIEIIQQLIQEACPFLKQGARLVLEIGHKQRPLLESRLRKQQLPYLFLKDFQDHDRVVEVGEVNV